MLLKAMPFSSRPLGSVQPGAGRRAQDEDESPVTPGPSIAGAIPSWRGHASPFLVSWTLSAIGAGRKRWRELEHPGDQVSPALDDLTARGDEIQAAYELIPDASAVPIPGGSKLGSPGRRTS
jgi:hypothetical protein